ncbi:hypothetical protein GE09DRAFT_1224157 [Coniochaeta sp. 2T2.1]|nr:hypothetical protein GE09DRAFT_1224157 [Coniochaeta sp. 2T2.1]
MSSDISNTSASTRLSAELSRLRQKLTTSPPISPSLTPPQPQSNHLPPPFIPSHNDTPDTALLIISSVSSTSTSQAPPASNPIREVYFPHNRTSGPGTKKCVGRPGRPKLRVDTDVPVVSLLANGRRYGTPWRDAAPARYGPDGMGSTEMGRWLRGDREEEVGGGGWVEKESKREEKGKEKKKEDDDGPWFEIDLGSEDGEGEEEQDDGLWSETDLSSENGEVEDGEEKDEFGLSPVCCATDEFGLPVLEYGDESDDEEDLDGYGPPNAVLTTKEAKKSTDKGK